MPLERSPPTSPVDSPRRRHLAHEEGQHQPVARPDRAVERVLRDAQRRLLAGRVVRLHDVQLVVQVPVDRELPGGAGKEIASSGYLRCNALRPSSSEYVAFLAADRT